MAKEKTSDLVKHFLDLFEAQGTLNGEQLKELYRTLLAIDGREPASQSIAPAEMIAKAPFTTVKEPTKPTETPPSPAKEPVSHSATFTPVKDPTSHKAPFTTVKPKK